MRQRYTLVAAVAALAAPSVGLFDSGSPAVSTSLVTDGPQVPDLADPSSRVVPQASAAAGMPQALMTGSSYIETFDGAPSAATPWNPSDWDVSVHSRDVGTWDELETMAADHGPACQGPPATHQVSSYDDAVFQCNNHAMTAISADGYGAIYLTPAALVDFSAGESVVSVDVSTLRRSGRDWWDIWLTPYDENVQLPLQDWLPDLNGPPRNAVHVYMDFDNNRFDATIFRNGAETEVSTATDAGYQTVLQPDAARRDTFTLGISRTSLRFGMPAYNLQWINTSIAALGWDKAVVQFGHHSYSPNKATTPGNPAPNTWHWDNVSISPAIPFTMIKGDRRNVGGGGTETVGFASPAPAGARLRFAGIGTNLQVSYDGGSSWQSATVQATSLGPSEEKFKSYWMPVPQGTAQVQFRGGNWYGGPWRVRDIAIWADNGLATPASAPSSGPLTGIADGGPRLLDTRPYAATTDAQASGIGPRQAGTTYELQVTGRAGIPADATAVALNLTSAEARGEGFLTAYPCGASVPNASSLNYGVGAPVANTAIVQLGAGGRVCLFVAVAATELIVDVSGWFVGNAGYSPRSPARLLDTRPQAATIDGLQYGLGVIPPGTTTELQVRGRAGVPNNATAVVLNLTSAEARGVGFATAYPCGSSLPTASSLNFESGAPTANSTIVQIGTGGRVCVFVADSATELIADVSGWFTGTTSYASRAPARLLDTRPQMSTADGASAGIGTRQAGTTYELQITGRANVPAIATAVMLNLTSAEARGEGFVTAYPCGAALPNASNLNFGVGAPVANAAIVELGSGGRVCLHVAGAATQLIADVGGWFTPNSSFQSF